MGQNKKKSFKLDGTASSGHFAFSTDENYKAPPTKESGTKTANEQLLKVWLEKKGRGGKTASVIKGFQGSETAMKELAKKLKVACGTGGSVKEGEIIIQGDHRTTLVEVLTKEGYQAKKAGG